jgi:hypothetical protein
MFALDRDLPAFEPNLFRDYAFLGQVLVTGVANSPGLHVELDSDPSPEDRDVRAGHVLTVDGVPLEVLQRVGATELSVSLVRPSRSGVILPPGKILDRPAYVATFENQILLAHRALRRLFALDDLPPGAAVLNPDELAPVEALGALHLIFAGASTGAGEDSPLAERAESYRRRFIREARRAAVLLDLDADGLPDSLRRAASVPLLRG